MTSPDAERVGRADEQNRAVVDRRLHDRPELFEQGELVAHVLDDGRCDPLVLRQPGGHSGGRDDRVDEGADLSGVGGPVDGRVDRGLRRAAVLVPEDHQEVGLQRGDAELDRSLDLGGRAGVPGDAHDEEVADALVEDDLRRQPRVGAREDDRERLLCDRRRLSAAGVAAVVGRRLGGVPSVTGHQPVQGRGAVGRTVVVHRGDRTIGAARCRAVAPGFGWTNGRPRTIERIQPDRRPGALGDGGVRRMTIEPEREDLIVS